MDGSNSVILGNMQKGDYTNVDFNLQPISTGEELPLNFEISYTSSDGLRQVQEKTLPLYASPSNPSIDSQLPEEERGSSSLSSLLWISVLALVLVGAVGFFAYKKHQKKMKEKNVEGKETGEKQMEEQMEEKKTGE
jgi:hypothetical protein